MRQQAIEKLCKEIITQWAEMPFTDDVCFSSNWKRMHQLTRKLDILLCRDGVRDAAVIREIMNGGIK